MVMGTQGYCECPPYQPAPSNATNSSQKLWDKPPLMDFWFQCGARAAIPRGRRWQRRPRSAPSSQSISPIVLLRWVLERVLGHLGRDSVAQVEAQRVTQAEQVAGHVGHFVGHLREAGRIARHVSRRGVLDP